MYADKKYQSKSRVSTLQGARARGGGSAATIQFVDNRPAAVAQNKLRELARTYNDQPAPLKPLAGEPLLQQKENRTGLPNQLKAGLEHLSGYSMDDVKVHYNSDRPARVQAHAYAQGTDIHLASGQEKHLPHEAWHVVQQKQGRVKPTMQLKVGVAVNDDQGLEKEADLMGAKALQAIRQLRKADKKGKITDGAPLQREVTRAGAQSGGGGMFRYIDRHGAKGNRAPIEQRGLLEQEAQRGEELLQQIMRTGGRTVDRREQLYWHARDIRAICWALYRRAHAKGQGHIGGMMVLDDGGALARYLMQGPKVRNQKGSKAAMADEATRGAPYYERSSSHFQERRDMSLGIDFHGFTRHAGGQRLKDKSMKLPLQKSTLHFGTLDGGMRTFIKFEYYGFLTKKDVALHSWEYIKTRFRQETGHREDHISKGLVKLIQDTLKQFGIRGDDLEKIKVGDKTFTPAKSGLYFARLVIDKRLSPERKMQALMELERMVNVRGEILQDHMSLRQHDEVIFSLDELMPRA